MRVLLFKEWRIIIIQLTDIILFLFFCKTDGNRKSQEFQLSTCIQQV